MEFVLAIVVLKAGMGSFVPKADVETLLNTPGLGSVNQAYKRPPPPSRTTPSQPHTTPNRSITPNHNNYFQTRNGHLPFPNNSPSSLLHHRHPLRPRLRPPHGLQRQLRVPPQFRMEPRLCHCFWYYHRRSRHPDGPLPKGSSPSPMVPPSHPSQPLTQELAVVPPHHPPRRPPRNPLLRPPRHGCP